MISVYLALGSNLGDREKYLRDGIRGLAAHGIDIIRCAGVYSTEPLEISDQPWFLNTALEVHTLLTPEQLLLSCLEVERENQRTRDRSKGPRTLDIDIIFYGSQIIHRPELTIPHPRFADRRFVLTPLADIASDFVDPLTRKTIRELLELCPDQSSVWFQSGPLQ
jgi:2-amino-4-hydroxy-6-hydroxymethyldihydropteridine diphosphokinase